MPRISLRKITAGALVFSSSIALAHAQDAAASSTRSTDTVAMNGQNIAASDDIVVTASKRPEKLRDVPSAITALSTDTLNKIGAQTFRDYVALVPGLSQRDAGNPGQGTVVLRGLNTGSAQTSNTVATYIDDAPFTSSGFFSGANHVTVDPDIADLDRIEVLKGPQGTLYGANSLGGLIRIVSKRPDTTKIEGFGQAEATAVDGGGQGYALRGALNLPLVKDVLALRVNGVYRRAPGWTDNVFTGTDNVNSSIIKGAHVSLLLTPTGKFSLEISGLIQNIDNNGFAFETDNLNTLKPTYGINKYSFAGDLGSTSRYRLVSGTSTYDFGPVSWVTSVTYAKNQSHIFFDYTKVYLSYLRGLSPTFAAILPADGRIIFDYQAPQLRKVTAETRLVSKRLGAFEFIAGGFFTNEHAYGLQVFNATNAQGVPLAAPYNVLIRSAITSDYREFAGFGNFTVYVSDKLDVTGGIRYAHNDQKVQTGGPGAVTFYAPRATGNFKISDNSTTYLATLRWRPTSTVSLYARAASGYRPGGPQSNPTLPAGAQLFVEPDTVWNYEAGVKANTRDGMFAINASVYHIDWSKIQLNTTVNGIGLLGNGGDAKVDGFEVETTIRPTKLLTISTSAGYTDARISKVDPGSATAIGAKKGDKLPFTPKWAVAMIGDQQVPLGDGVMADLGTTLRFRSNMPSSYPGTAINPNIKIPSMTTLDLRAGVTFGRYLVQVRAENVLNEHGYTNAVTTAAFAGQAVPTQSSVNRPRSFTLSVSARF